MIDQTPTDFGAKWQHCMNITEGDIILFDELVWKRIKGRGKPRYEIAGQIRIIAQAKDRDKDFLNISVMHIKTQNIEPGRRSEVADKVRYVKSNPDTKRKLSKLSKNYVYRTNWSDEIARQIIQTDKI